MSKRRVVALMACALLGPMAAIAGGAPARADLAASVFTANFASGVPAGVAVNPGWNAATASAPGGVRALRLTATSLPASGDAAMSWANTVPAGKWFLTGEVMGSLHRTAQLTANGASSSPLQLDSVWQRVGLSITQPTPGPLRIDVLPTGAWRGGDSISVANLRLAPSTPSVTTVQSGTRIIDVNGQPFNAKGFVYWPAPIGEDLVVQSWADPTQCQQDARLLGGAGATLLRIPMEYATPILLSNYIACLDSFAANGIGVLWAINAPYGQEKPVSTGQPTLQQTVDAPVNSTALFPLYEQWIQQVVNDFGSHPATYFYHVNNEADGSVDGTCSTRDLWLGHQSPTPQVGLADQLLAYTKSLDPNHLVTTVIGGCSDQVNSGTPQGLATFDLPHLDFWGINDYGVGSYQPQSFYDNLKLDPRPVIFTEFGEDRYSCRAPSLVGFVCQSGYPYYSGEDQVSQGNWDTKAWNAIASNLATSSNPQGAVDGGLDFMYSDLWWYGLPFVGFVTVEHDTIGSTPWPSDDGVQNFKWWGVSAALLPGATQQRGTSLGFDAFADQWSTPAPTISNVQVAVSRDATTGTCTATVSWTTSAPTIGQLLAGVDLEIGNDGGDMVFDNTLFQDAGDDTVASTTHSFSVGNITDQESYKFQPRSFTSTGASRTVAPIVDEHIVC